MRTIAEIKESIAVDFMRNDDVASAYGFTPGDSFTAHFSKASIESVLFYTFACATWVLEGLFGEHKSEVSGIIEDIIPHRPKWYRDKMLVFMKGKELLTDTDSYDISGMSDDDIASARVVKHAVATENEDVSILTIKVAGENAGVREPLDAETETQLAAYIAEIRDAGVRINLVNMVPDKFFCAADIYYNPILLPENVESECILAVKNYIENLPFNGEYTNMALVDALQAVEGVKIVEFKGAAISSDGETEDSLVNARAVPDAGYFTVGRIIINMYEYE